MNGKYISFIFILFLLLGGCTSYYQYRSNGGVSVANGATQNAVLYWYGEEGRLWYGKQYTQLDSGLTLRICKVGARPFDLSGTSRLELPAKAGDLRVADINEQGTLQPVTPPLRLRTGDYCGIVLLSGHSVTTRQLQLSRHPAIAILCKNLNKPDRYPESKIYMFGAIRRIEVSKDNRHAPDPCVAQ